MSRIPLRKDEQIIARFRRYGLTLVGQWVIALIPLVCAGVYMFALFRQGTWGTVVFTTLIILTCILTLRIVLLSRGSVLMLTSHRIIDTAKEGIFRKVITEVEMDDIEDITVIQRGILKTLCNCGTVEIHIRDSKTRIRVDHMHRPVGVQRLIREVRRRYARSDVQLSSIEIISALKTMSRRDLLHIQKKLSELL